MQLSLELNTSELWRMLPYQIPCDTELSVLVTERSAYVESLSINWVQNKV